MSSKTIDDLKSDIVLNDIVKKYICLDDDEVKKTNQQLHEVLDCLVDKMKLKDSYFSELYRERAYTGSFYKQTRVANPDEFDLNLVFRLPKDEEFQVRVFLIEK